MNFDPAKLAKDRADDFAAEWERKLAELPEHTRSKVQRDPEGADGELLAHHVKAAMRAADINEARDRIFATLPKNQRDALYHDPTHAKWDDIDEEAEKLLAAREDAFEKWIAAEGVEGITL